MDEKSILKIKHKIERYNKRIKSYENNIDNLSVHGYWSLGYFEDRKSVLEEILDEINASSFKEEN